MIFDKMIGGAAQQDKKVWQPLSLGHNRYVAFSQFRSKALPPTSPYGARERENLGTSRVSERVRKTRFAFSQLCLEC